MSEWVEEGKKAPDFTLPADDGSKVKLSAVGKPVVLYFYPRDDTPGCTREACAFRDRKKELQKQGAVVLGVSTDDVASHVKFRDKHELNFPLLADTEHKVAEKYGAARKACMERKAGASNAHLSDRCRSHRAQVWKRVQVDGHDDRSWQHWLNFEVQKRRRFRTMLKPTPHFERLRASPYSAWRGDRPDRHKRYPWQADCSERSGRPPPR